MRIHRYAALTALVLAVMLGGACRRTHRLREVAYVSAPQAFLRDRVAAVYNKTGVVKNGEKLEILDRDRRFAQVRKADGTIGWVEQRYLISEAVFKELNKLSDDHRSDPVQATGTARNETNIHLEPARDSDHLYQVSEGQKVEVLKLARSEKRLPGEGPAAKAGKAPAAAMEDWWLVRDSAGHAGWVLARMIDLDVPLEIAQYAEGQRIIAFFVLNQVADGEKKVPQYLMALADPRGASADFDQIRVFTWNVKRHRYETAYRERKLAGVLPVTTGSENFDKEGTLPVFTVRVRAEDGTLSERKYKLDTPIVKRVLAPGEAPARAAPAPKAKRRGR